MRHGKDERTYRLEFVSNQAFSDDEFERWKSAMAKNNMPLPTIREVDAKAKELETYVNYRFNDQDVDFIVKEKKRFIKDTDKIAEKKIELLKKREEASQLNDADLIKEIDQQIEDLNEKASEMNIKRSGNFNLLAYALFYIFISYIEDFFVNKFKF